MSIHRLIGKAIGTDLDCELLVVMPVYNEADNIRAVLETWSTALSAHTERFAFVLVNDGSTDNTQSILEECEGKAPTRFVILSKPNSGHGNTCRVGYDVACTSSCDWVFQIDSDGQCDPQYFAAFWQARENADCIFGFRQSRDDGRARAITSQICRWGSSLLCGADLRDPNVPYRLIRRRVLANALHYIHPGFNIHNVALTFVLKKTPSIRWAYIPIHFRDRQGGRNSINLLNVGQWGMDMLLELWKLRRALKQRA